MEKLWYYGKNYDTMEKTMVLYRKLWNFDLLWKKLWYYEKNYGTIVNQVWLKLAHCMVLENRIFKCLKCMCFAILLSYYLEKDMAHNILYSTFNGPKYQ